MDGTGFLKTVSFGGFDKKDVLAYVDELNTIEGTVPAPGQMPAGCRFSPRCPYATERCRTEPPGIYHAGNALVSCFKYEGGQDEN